MGITFQPIRLVNLWVKSTLTRPRSSEALAYWCLSEWQ